VAHRPSTVTLADRVALLENGRITAVGTHSRLLAENDHYRFVISSLEDEEKRERADARLLLDETTARDEEARS
jgi:ATP-binding cassette subfamily B protein